MTDGDDEWREMAKHYGGLREEGGDKGRAAYEALLIGCNSGFDAVLGGGRTDRGEYAKLEAHGFYWMASTPETLLKIAPPPDL